MKAKPKTKTGKLAKPKPKRLAVKGATLDLLKIARKVGIQRDIAEAVGLTKMDRALRAKMETDMGAPQSIDSQILVLQAIRTGNPMLELFAFGLIDSMAEEAAQTDAHLKKLYQTSEAKHREAGHGEDELWPEDQRPAEIQELFDAYWERLYELKVAFLRLHGEDAMADLLMADPEAYQAKIDRAIEEGQDQEKMRAAIDAGFNGFLNE